MPFRDAKGGPNLKSKYPALANKQEAVSELQKAAGPFASRVAGFCSRQGMWQFEALITRLQVWSACREACWDRLWMFALTASHGTCLLGVQHVASRVAGLCSQQGVWEIEALITRLQVCSCCRQLAVSCFA